MSEAIDIALRRGRDHSHWPVKREVLIVKQNARVRELEKNMAVTWVQDLRIDWGKGQRAKTYRVVILELVGERISVRLPLHSDFAACVGHPGGRRWRLHVS